MPSDDVAAPRISSVSGTLALAALPTGFLVLGWFFYDWSHSALLGISMIFAAVAVGGGMWMSLQTRITSSGVSGFNALGLELPRRAQLSWREITRVDISEHTATVWGEGATINIPVALFPDRKAVAAFIATHMDQVVANRERVGT